MEGVAGLEGAYAGYFQGQLFTTAFLGLPDVEDPAAPPAHEVRIYGRLKAGSPDKMELCARFDNGSIVVLATQP